MTFKGYSLGKLPAAVRAVAARGGQELAAVGAFAKESTVQRIQGHYYHADQGQVYAQANVIISVKQLQSHYARAKSQSRNRNFFIMLTAYLYFSFP